METLPPFLAHLWTMIEDPTTNDIISWSDSQPNAFVVRDVKGFEKSVLRQYFKHNRFQSFVRQLNMYDFYKVRDAHGGGTWTHPYLRRGEKNLLFHIKRKNSQDSEAKPSANAELHQQISDHERRIRKLEQELTRAKDVHMTMQTKVERLEQSFNKFKGVMKFFVQTGPNQSHGGLQQPMLLKDEPPNKRSRRIPFKSTDQQSSEIWPLIEFNENGSESILQFKLNSTTTEPRHVEDSSYLEPFAIMNSSVPSSSPHDVPMKSHTSPSLSPLLAPSDSLRRWPSFPNLDDLIFSRSDPDSADILNDMLGEDSDRDMMDAEIFEQNPNPSNSMNFSGTGLLSRSPRSKFLPSPELRISAAEGQPYPLAEHHSSESDSPPADEGQNYPLSVKLPPNLPPPSIFSNEDSSLPLPLSDGFVSPQGFALPQVDNSSPLSSSSDTLQSLQSFQSSPSRHTFTSSPSSEAYSSPVFSDPLSPALAELPQAQAQAQANSPFSSPFSCQEHSQPSQTSQASQACSSSVPPPPPPQDMSYPSIQPFPLPNSASANVPSMDSKTEAMNTHFSTFQISSDQDATSVHKAEQILQQLMQHLSSMYSARGFHNVFPENSRGFGCWFTNFTREAPPRRSLLPPRKPQTLWEGRNDWGILFFGLKEIDVAA